MLTNNSRDTQSGDLTKTAIIQEHLTMDTSR
nr:MAG TPA: hypothetical protein [Bacteriophage sp.]